VLLFWHQVINRLRRSSRQFAKLIAGEGVMLIKDGEILQQHVRHAGVTAEELLQALREHGVATVAEVRLGVLEPDGSVSVIRYDDLKPGMRPHHRIKMMRHA
jgi:uncharacterized membrane protein YcaP (DUF421 family)